MVDDPFCSPVLQDGSPPPGSLGGPLRQHQQRPPGVHTPPGAHESNRNPQPELEEAPYQPPPAPAGATAGARAAALQGNEGIEAPYARCGPMPKRAPHSKRSATLNPEHSRSSALDLSWCLVLPEPWA